MENKIEFIQSKNWWISKDFNYILDNAAFVFTSKNSRRPHIVTKEKIDGMDCFQLDNDNNGIMISGASKFKEEYYQGSALKREDKDIREFVTIFLIKWGAGEFIILPQNPYKKFMKQVFGEYYTGLPMAIVILYWIYEYIKTLF